MITRKCKEECILLCLQFNCKEEIGSNMIDQSTFKHAEIGTSVHDIVRVLIMFGPVYCITVYHYQHTYLCTILFLAMIFYTSAAV